MSSRPRKRRQPGSGRPEGERTWSVDDALRQYEGHIAWLRSGDGTRNAYLMYHDTSNGTWPGAGPTDSARWELAEKIAQEGADQIARTPPIWCDPPMGDLIAAAADTHPPEPLHVHDLPAESGMVLFARPLPAVWQDEHPPARPAPISAITWKSYLQDGELALTVIGWTRRSALEGYRDPKLTIHYRGLAPVHAEALLYGIPPAELIGPAPLTKVLQSFAALCRTPLVRDETEPGSKAARQAAQRAGRPDPVIRRVYLRRPEHAQEELEAAREARAGAPKRGHWVRGHWKRQWHASIGEHRTIWISGYPRGDFTAGTVTGSKVLVASDRRQLGKLSVDPSRAAAAQGFPSQLLINPTEQAPILQGETPATPNVRQARRK